MQSIKLESEILTPSKVVCVGRNYTAHIAELNNELPDQMVLFNKPNSALSSTLFATHNNDTLHYETELCFVIKNNELAGVGLGLDLTKRTVQSKLKNQGLPWERAKAFDGACPLSPFVPKAQAGDLHALSLQLDINGERRQQGSAAEMITPIVALVRHIANQFSLLPGDVVITGTPAGVGVLNPGDELTLAIAGKLQVQTRIAE